jgi:hypothetical protein
MSSPIVRILAIIALMIPIILLSMTYAIYLRPVWNNFWSIQSLPSYVIINVICFLLGFLTVWLGFIGISLLLC